jgi:hypothetical protein
MQIFIMNDVVTINALSLSHKNGVSAVVVTGLAWPGLSSPIFLFFFVSALCVVTHTAIS